MPAVNRKIFKAPYRDTPGLNALVALPDPMAARAIRTNVEALLRTIQEEETNKDFLELRYEEAQRRGISVHAAGTHVLDDLFSILALYINHRLCPADVYRAAAIEILAHSRRTKRLGIM